MTLITLKPNSIEIDSNGYTAFIRRAEYEDDHSIRGIESLRNFTLAGLIEYIDFLREVERELKIMNGVTGND